MLQMVKGKSRSQNNLFDSHMQHDSFWVTSFLVKQELILALPLPNNWLHSKEIKNGVCISGADNLRLHHKHTGKCKIQVLSRVMLWESLIFSNVVWEQTSVWMFQSQKFSGAGFVPPRQTETFSPRSLFNYPSVLPTLHLSYVKPC